MPEEFDVKEAFFLMPSESANHEIDVPSGKGIDTKIGAGADSGHLQGIVRYAAGDKEYWILSCSKSQNGLLYVAEVTRSWSGSPKGTMLSSWSVPGSDHPGSMQVLGHYLVVPTEIYDKSTTLVYDLSVPTLPRQLTLNNQGVAIPNDKGKAGSAGICHYGQDGYLLVTVRSDGELDLFTIDKDWKTTKHQTWTTSDFTKKNWTASDKVFRNYTNGVGLLKDAYGIYLVGFAKDGKDDAADLYTLDLDGDLDHRLIKVDFKLCNFTGGGGRFGASFEWGAGVSMDGPLEMRVLVNSRGTASLGSNLANPIAVSELYEIP